MPGVVWESVKNQIVAQLTTVLAGVRVFDGPTVTGSAPASYLMVGHLPSREDDSAGGFDQEVGPDGFSATETGTVSAELAAVTGNTTVPSVFATFAAIAAWVQADMTLGGVLSPGSTVTTSAEVVEAQTAAGAVQRLIVTFHYFTRVT